MKWPDDYWPPPKKKATKIQWKETIEKIKKDKKTLEKIVSNPRTDLFAKIKWGEGQTILKEILVVSDHNAYHIGEFSIMRQAMDTWNR